MKKTVSFVSLLFVLSGGAIVAINAQSQTDVVGVRAVLNAYRASEDAGDHAAQGALMTPDRVWVSNSSGRRVDNLENMRIQQAQADRRKKAIPELQQFSEDRDLIIRFYGNGSVAVVTFYRHATRVFPVGTSAELMKEYEPGKEWIMLVLEKRDGKWMIVATHV